MSDSTTLSIVLGTIALVGMAILGWFSSSTTFINPLKDRTFFTGNDFIFIFGFFLFVIVPVLITIVYDFKEIVVVTPENTSTNVIPCPVATLTDPIKDELDIIDIPSLDSYDGGASLLKIAHSTIISGDSCPQCSVGWTGHNCVCLKTKGSIFLGVINPTLVDLGSTIEDGRDKSTVFGTTDSCETYCSEEKCTYFTVSKSSDSTTKIKCTLYKIPIITTISGGISTSDGCPSITAKNPLVFKAVNINPLNVITIDSAYIFIDGIPIPARYWLVEDRSPEVFSKTSSYGVYKITNNNTYTSSNPKKIPNIPKGTGLTYINTSSKTLVVIISPDNTNEDSKELRFPKFESSVTTPYTSLKPLTLIQLLDNSSLEIFFF